MRSQQHSDGLWIKKSLIQASIKKLFQFTSLHSYHTTTRRISDWRHPVHLGHYPSNILEEKGLIGFPVPEPEGDVCVCLPPLKVSKRTDFPFGLNPISRRSLFKCADLWATTRSNLYKSGKATRKAIPKLDAGIYGGCGRVPTKLLQNSALSMANCYNKS